jgi:hypothetical protein
MRRVARDAWDAAREVAPVVEAVTGLALPPRVTVRCTGLLAIQRQWRRQADTQLARDIARLQLDPTGEEAAWARAVIPKKQRATKRILLLIDGRTLLHPVTAEPEVVVLPSVWEMAGACPAARRRAIAHELVHVAQRTAGGERLRDALDSLVRNRHTGQGLDDLALRPAYEGQAYVAEQLVLDKLGLTVAPPKPTPVYRRYLEKHGHATGRQTKAAARLDPGENFARAILADHGPDALNAIWTRPDRAPTNRELDHPTVWAARHHLGPDPR